MEPSGFSSHPSKAGEMFCPREYDWALPVCTATATAAAASRDEAAKEMRFIIYSVSITSPGAKVRHGRADKITDDSRRAKVLAAGLRVRRRRRSRRRAEAQRASDDEVVLRQPQLRAPLGHFLLELLVGQRHAASRGR